MILVPFEDKITYDDDGSCTYSAWYSEFRLKGYYNWASNMENLKMEEKISLLVNPTLSGGGS